mgnify:FL=1
MDKKSEKISGALGELSEDIIEKADSERQKLINKRKLAIRRAIIGFGSAAACFVLAVGVFAAVGRNRGAINSTDPEQPCEAVPPSAAVTTVLTDENLCTTSPDGTLNDVITSGSFHTGTINSRTTASTASEGSEPPHTTTVVEPNSSATPPTTTATEKTSEICSVPTAPATKATTKTAKSEKTTTPTTTIKHRDDVEINAEPLCYVEYPKWAEYPNIEDFENLDVDGYFFYNPEYDKKLNEYNAGVRERRKLAKNINEYSNFYKTSAREILGSADGENMVYSPLALYEALSMLAEITDGSTRDEVLEVLDSPDIETQRDRAQTLFVSNYSEATGSMVLPAASLWINVDYPYNKEAVDSLAFNYFAESYLFDGYDESSTARIQNWINEKTRGLLKEAVEGVELTPDSILNICTTLYFNGRWSDWFYKDYTEEMTFHSPSGDITTDFMYKQESGSLFLGSNFTAVINSFENDGGLMYFILPNEGETVDDVLSSDEYLDFVFIRNPRQDFDYYDAIVHQRIPKFDISSDVSLNQALKNLGIEKVFTGNGDFSNLISEKYPVSVDKVQHAARIKIDEEGCEAAAYVDLGLVGEAPPPPEEVYFTADRPFIIVIKTDTNQPLFMGVVNNP